jgi:hypothetical protein
MRDKERIPRIIKIPRIINKLEETWKEYPDWRLGQLIANISIEIRNEDDDNKINKEMFG